jgi:uncharacterized membrane protein
MAGTSGAPRCSTSKTSPPSCSGKPYASLDERTRRVARHVAERTHIARDVGADREAPPSFGQRAADRVAAFGGSWTFVGLFAVAVALWMATNGPCWRARGRPSTPIRSSC